jgi:hypothetical protein
MSQVKRDLEEHEDRLAIIERLGIEEGALVLDEDTDEVSSADDEQANKDFYARAFKEWAAGNISGDAEDIFDAVTSAIESWHDPTTHVFWRTLDGQITDEDRKPVVFCAIHDLEGVLAIATEDAFLAALKATQDEKFKNWRFPEVYRYSTPEKPPRKDYPFKLNGVLPWWTRTQHLIEAMEAKP